MGIRETYSERILEEVLREFLEEGTVPTADQLIEAYDTRLGNHTDLTKPFSLDEEPNVEELQESSASAYNAFLERIQSDLAVLYEDMGLRTKETMAQADRWHVETERQRRRLVELERRIDALLLLRADTAGYFAFVEDNLTDFSKIDEDNTTAKVDIQNHMATLGEAPGGSKLSVLDLPKNAASFVLLTRDSVASSSTGAGTSLDKAIDDTSDPWQITIHTTSAQKPVSGELRVYLGATPVELTRIEIALHSPDFSAASTVMGMYSLDNYSWAYLPCDNYVQTVDNKAIFVLSESTAMNYVKFIITKNGPDETNDTSYLYIFGTNSIKFFSKAFEPNGEDGYLITSTAMSALDEDGNPLGFNKVALQACQITPVGTGIYYWIKAENDTEDTDWLRIDPFNIEGPVAPTFIDLGRLVPETIEDLALTNKDNSASVSLFAKYNDQLQVDRMAFIATDNDPDSNPYEIGSGVADDIIDDTITIYRNTSSGSPGFLRDSVFGCHHNLETGRFETCLLVKNQDGVEFDFGEVEVILNDKLVSHQVVIPTGISRLQIAVADINHPIITALVPAVDLIFEGLCQRIGVFDLIHNTAEDDYLKYAIDITSDGSKVFMVRFNPDIDDYENERFAITYSTGESVFDRITLKAQLVAQNGDTSPILTAYRLKLGC